MIMCPITLSVNYNVQKTYLAWNKMNKNMKLSMFDIHIEPGLCVVGNLMHACS